MGELSAASDIGGMLLSSVGGALVPLSVVSAWVAYVAAASPGYRAARGLHAALDGDTHTSAAACGTLLGVALLRGTRASARLQGRSGRLVTLYAGAISRRDKPARPPIHFAEQGIEPIQRTRTARARKCSRASS